MGDVYARDARGEVWAIPAENAEAAFASGKLRPETAEEAEARVREEKYGTDAQAAVAGVEAAGRALTLGGSTYVQTALGADPEAIKAREELNPVAAGIGTGIGIAAPLVLTAGASAPAAAGSAGATTVRSAASLSAPALISRAGSAATKAVSSALPAATTTAGKMAVRATALGAGGALEGAAYGVGEVVHEAALGDPNLTAQSALSTIGLSAALGAGFGAFAGAAEVGIPAAVSKGREAVGDVLTKAKGAFEKHYPAVAEKMTGVDRETVSQLLKNRHEVFTNPEVRTKVATELADSLQTQYGSVEKALKAANREIRPAEIQNLAKGVAPEAAHAEASRLYDRFSAVIDDMKARPELFPPMYAAKLDKHRQALVREAMDHQGFVREASTANPAKIFGVIDDAKKSLDDIAKFGREVGPEHADAIAAVKGLRAELKGALENEAVWGRVGARQAAYNEAQNEYFTALKEFRKNFMQKSTTRTGAIEFKISPVKVNTYFNQMGDARGQMRSEAMDNFVNASRRVLDEIEASHSAAPVTQFDKSALSALIGKSDELTATARKQASVTQLMNQLEPRMSWGSNPVSSSLGQNALGLLGETGAGAMIGGPVGAALGAAHSIATAATSVPFAVKTLAMLERVAQRTAKVIDAGADAIVKGTRKAAPLAREEVIGLAKSFGQSGEESRALYAKRATQLRDMAQDPEQLHNALAAQSKGMLDHAPNTSQAMQMTSATAVGFLASKLPEPPPMGPLSPKWEPSQAEIAKFNRYYEAAEDPLSLLTQAQSGILTPEAVEAVSMIYPQLFEKIQAALVEKMTESGGEIPYRNHLMLNMILGQDVDGSFSPVPIQKNQAAIAGPSAKTAENQPGGAIKPTAKGAEGLTLSNRFLTPGQATAQRNQE